MTIKIHFTGFWGGFHDRTNPVHEGFFLELFKEVYGLDVSVGSFNDSVILVENTQVAQSLRTAKTWHHTYLYSGESYLRSDAKDYTCVLYGQRNHNNIVNVPLYLPYVICSHSQSFIESNKNTPVTTVPSKTVLSVISNPGGSFRNDFLEGLEKRGISVTYAGHYKNNTGQPFHPSYNSVEFQEYCKQFKFIVSMENSEEDTYITEKIMHGLLGHSVPVYWGSKQVSNYFNPKRFIEVTDRDSAIDKIATMTDAEWLAMMNERPFTEFGQSYTLQRIAKYIKNLIMPKTFPLLTQVYIICNPVFEPVRYERCKSMCNELGILDRQTTLYVQRISILLQMK